MAAAAWPNMLDGLMNELELGVMAVSLLATTLFAAAAAAVVGVVMPPFIRK